MTSRHFSGWMWSEALSMLERADRLHRQFFTHTVGAWEPPIDIVETAEGLVVQIALPGVPADSITITLDAAGMTVSALRPFPCRDAESHVHRIEIPYGRFERQIGLPLGDPYSPLQLSSKSLEAGVLTLIFTKKEGV
ncbi:MAG TPA: Hsp20/alpha crystallin family protein [Burkholderiales bacterium]|nr:Hsp20/alpha crystallin family protein [Burkholderiales bacterium]